MANRHGWLAIDAPRPDDIGNVHVVGRVHSAVSSVELLRNIVAR